MPHQRSTNDRRRRVVYTSQNADTSSPTAASRRAKEKLREARQPTKAYGAHVQRRLRGRWFSLVPVKRRTLITAASIIACCSLLLSYAHYAAVTWPSLAHAPDIARPLRLDHADSFGRWFTCVLLAGSSGAALLIYQLRRYRNDDFRGHYRLWRLVLIVLMLASVNSLVLAVDWGGALLDAAFGKRVAFSGYDWLRIVLGLGGVVLALRLVVEVRRSRWALVCILIACGFLALPEATKWKLFEVNTVERWTLVTTAPLLGYTALFLALAGYLRVLYREVRNIEDSETLSERLQGFRGRLFTGKDSDEQDAPKRKKWRRQAVATEPEVEEEEEVAEAEQDEESDVEPQRKKRRWLGLRAAKPESTETDSSDDTEQEEPRRNKRKKKRRFGLRLDPTEQEDQEPDSDQEPDEQVADQADEDVKPKRRFGLSRRKKPAAVEADDQQESDDQSPEPPSNSQQADDAIDPDEIDWDSMSKSERRRLRKKLKRQGRAA